MPAPSVSLLAAPLLCLALAACAPETRKPLFTEKRRYEDITPLYKWTSTLARMEEDGGSPFPATRKLRALPLSRLVARVDKTINGYAYIDDEKAVGVPDYWQTPAEFLQRGGGDCEDFAIAKYAWLRALGLPERSLRITVARDRLLGIHHAFLLVNTPKGQMILNNETTASTRDIALARYAPIYSFNRESWSVY